MDRKSSNPMPFIHPSRAHLFQKPPISDDALKQSSTKQVSRTWNNRQNQSNQKHEDDQLLVFGYASKLFPPDEHSASIARNKHLILWNEDYKLNLFIDRYDCRASLHNLTEFDGDAWNKSYQLSDEETKLEKRLDEERYRALFVEELEEDIRHEEELKRLHASIASDEQDKGLGEVAYQYDEEEGEQYDPTEPTNDEEDDQKVFIAPSSLAVPSEMEIPATEKMHAIIEKTALFVSKQGVQMEIVLKAKQANNSQFQFLQFDHYLNPYYKHMVKRIKEGKYTPGITKEEEQEEEEEEESSDDDGGYLHPSLFAASHKKTAPDHEEKTKAIRKIDPDHPLAKLIEKGRQANAIKQYQKMAEAVHNYYQQHGLKGVQTCASSLEPPPLPSFMTMAGLGSEKSQTSQQYYSHSLSGASTAEDGQQSATPHFSVADMQWTSDAPIVPPPPDLQEVVEEIAKKVAVEGKETEKALICNADVNYSFLNPWHELHPYYQFRKMSWLRVLYPPPPPDPSNADSNNTEAEQEVEESEENDSKSIAPISFSIKARSESMKKPALVPSSASSVLAEGASDEEKEEVEIKVVEPKKSKARRRFTDNPPDSATSNTETTTATATTTATTVTVSKDPKPEVPASPKKEVVVKPSVVKPSPAPSSTSTFTAVTSTGEAASISDLREKQAARRKKAMLFLKAKTEAEKQKKVELEKAEEKNKLAAIASEDIFDLSTPVEEGSPVSKNGSDKDAAKEEEEEVKPSISKLEILQKISSLPHSRSSSPRSVSSIRSKKRRFVEKSRTRSRSRSRSRVSEPSHSLSRDLASLYSHTKEIKRNLEELARQAETSTSSDEIGDVPSAYRVEKSKKYPATRSATAAKRAKKKSHDRASKRRKRSRAESSLAKSSKHKRSKRSSREKKKKKKKKKEKKTKKSKKKMASSSSSSEVEIQEIIESGEEASADQEMDVEESGGNAAHANNASSVAQSEDSSSSEDVNESPSEGELVSE